MMATLGPPGMLCSFQLARCPNLRSNIFLWFIVTKPLQADEMPNPEAVPCPAGGVGD